jgi:hypothetical protein
MILYYLLACIPSAIAATMWVMTKRIVWWEWLISTALAFAVCGIVHVSVIKGMTSDVETWSGQIQKAVHYPRWVEEYQEAVYKTVTKTRTVGFGKNRRTETYTDREFSHYETKHRTHHEYWEATANFGVKNERYRISQSFYNEIKSKWGGDSCLQTVKGRRPGFYSGDRNDYVLSRKTDYIYPTVATYTFENRIKAAPSVFSFPKVPEKANVYSYPKNNNWRSSNRLLGSSSGAISILSWDRMNSRLGPFKKVNVILIGFGDGDSGIARLQEAKWIGGKKNDLVLCYGGPNDNPTWSHVFGWTEKEVVKRNLETILLKNPIDEKIVSKIEDEINKNYQIKEWKKFDYISIEPPTWTYLMLLGILVVTQGGFLAWSYFNSREKK